MRRLTDAQRTFAIAAGGLLPAHRTKIQRLVREHANGWWHHLPDVWIVMGHDHKFWANAIAPVFSDMHPAVRPRLLILELPRERGQRMFAVRGAVSERAKDWLWSRYLGKPRPSHAAKRVPPAD